MYSHQYWEDCSKRRKFGDNKRNPTSDSCLKFLEYLSSGRHKNYSFCSDPVHNHYSFAAAFLSQHKLYHSQQTVLYINMIREYCLSFCGYKIWYKWYTIEEKKFQLDWETQVIRCLQISMWLRFGHMPEKFLWGNNKIWHYTGAQYRQDIPLWFVWYIWKISSSLMENDIAFETKCFYVFQYSWRGINPNS
jgi:hypothetical protein